MRSKKKPSGFGGARAGRQAENCHNYLQKGSLVCVEGRLQPARAWVSEDGEARANIEMTALDVRFLGSGNGNGGQSDDDDIAEEEIPF